MCRSVPTTYMEKKKKIFIYSSRAKHFRTRRQSGSDILPVDRGGTRITVVGRSFPPEAPKNTLMSDRSWNSKNVLPGFGCPFRSTILPAPRLRYAHVYSVTTRSNVIRYNYHYKHTNTRLCNRYL